MPIDFKTIKQEIYDIKKGLTFGIAQERKTFPTLGLYYYLSLLYFIVK